MNIISQVFHEFGLTINIGKTETMVFNWNEAIDGNYPQSIITIQGNQIQNSTSFKYLGVWFTKNCLNIGEEEINHRVNSAHNAFAEHRKLLTNMSISINTRIMFLESLVRSRLTYGCHCWRPTASEINKIEATYRHFLRSMIWNGFKRVNPPSQQQNQDNTDGNSEDDGNETEEEIDWSYIINNDRLYELTNSKDISTYYKLQQMNWISHIIRRENDNISKILTFHSTKRKRLGRSTTSILERVVQRSGISYTQFLKDSFRKMNNQQSSGMYVT